MKTMTVLAIWALGGCATALHCADARAADAADRGGQPAQHRSDPNAEPARVQALAMERFPDTFGGLYIEQRPRYRVRVNFSRDAEVSLRQLTDDVAFEAVTVSHSIRDLERIGETVKQVLQAKRLDCTLSVDPRQPSLTVWLPDQDLAPAQTALAEAGLAQPFVVVRAYERIETTGAADSVGGGLRSR